MKLSVIAAEMDRNHARLIELAREIGTAFSIDQSVIDQLDAVPPRVRQSEVIVIDQQRAIIALLEAVKDNLLVEVEAKQTFDPVVFTPATGLTLSIAEGQPDTTEHTDPGDGIPKEGIEATPDGTETELTSETVEPAADQPAETVEEPTPEEAPKDEPKTSTRGNRSR